MGTNWWESLAYSPHERGELFLEMVSYLHDGEFPMKGTDVTGTFLQPKDPEFTIIVLKVRNLCKIEKL